MYKKLFINIALILFVIAPLNTSWSLCREGSSEQQVDCLIKALKDSDPKVRRKAAVGFARSSNHRVPQAVPFLVEALEDEDIQTRREAAYALGSYGPQAEDAIPALDVALDDSDDWVRRRAQTALKRIWGLEREDMSLAEKFLKPAQASEVQPPGTLAELIERVEGSCDRETTIEAIQSLVGLNTRSLVLMTSLLPKAQCPRPYSRALAVRALARVGPVRAVTPYLIAATKDKHKAVRRYAVEALGIVALHGLTDNPTGNASADETATEALMDGLRDEYWSVREASAKALGEMRVARAVDALIKILNNPQADSPYYEKRVRLAAVQALGNIGDARAVPFLIEIGKQDQDIREAADRALGRIGTEEALSALEGQPDPSPAHSP